MDWKEDTIKATIVAILGLIGHAFLKFFKKKIYPLHRVFKDGEKIDDLEKCNYYSSQLIQSIIHVLPHPMYIMDMDGNLEYVNPAWCEITGFRDPEDAHGMGFMRTIPDRNVDKIMKVNEQYVNHPGNFEGSIVMMHIYTKEEFEAYYRTELIYNKENKPIKSIGILLNIIKTQKKHE